MNVSNTSNLSNVSNMSTLLQSHSQVIKMIVILSDTVKLSLSNITEMIVILSDIGIAWLLGLTTTMMTQVTSHGINSHWINSIFVFEEVFDDAKASS